MVLIHGHNMKSGARFGRLRRYAKYDYAARHPLVGFRTIRDPGEVCYAVIAAFDAFIAALRERSYWQSPVDARAGDRLLMLVTCSCGHADGRFILVCRRLREGETREDVEALFR